MNQIKIVFEEKRIKQTWLSEKLNKSCHMTNSYVQNRSQPSLEDLNRIANILDLDIKELIASNKPSD
ncbi:MAG: putative transcriptional regulator [Parvicella sp.]|jgi:transcriptional regulator with XRE-family HTH domain